MIIAINEYCHSLKSVRDRELIVVINGPTSLCSFIATHKKKAFNQKKSKRRKEESCGAGALKKEEKKVRKKRREKRKRKEGRKKRKKRKKESGEKGKIRKEGFEFGPATRNRNDAIASFL